MATSAVVVGTTPQGGGTYWAYSIDSNGVYTETGKPRRPMLSKGLKAALVAKPSTTPSGQKILYWSTYDGLRSMVKVGNGTGFPIYSDSLFQPVSVVYVTAPRPEPTGSGVPKTPSPSGLETLSKNMIRIIGGAAIKTVDTLVNPLYSTFNNLQSLVTNPSEFVKSSPLMEAAKALYDYLKQQPESQQSPVFPTQEVYCLPGEAIGDISPYGSNPIYDDGSDSGSPTTPETETKEETLKTVLDTLNKIIQKFVDTPDNERQPGSSIWDKLAGILDTFDLIDDALSKILAIPKQIPSVLLDIPDMLDAISQFLSPLLQAIGQSIAEEKQTGKAAQVDFTALIDSINGPSNSVTQSLTGTDRSLYQLEEDFQNWLKEDVNRIFLLGLVTQTNELYDPEY